MGKNDFNGGLRLLSITVCHFKFFMKLLWIYIYIYCGCFSWFNGLLAQKNPNILLKLMKIQKNEALTKINTDCNIFVFVTFQGCLLRLPYTIGTIVSTSISTCGI